MSQLSQPPAFSYPNQRVIRPPLPKTQRNRALFAGAVSNTVLSAGLGILSAAGLVIAFGLIWEFVLLLIRASGTSTSSFGDQRPVEWVLERLGYDPSDAWIFWAVIVVLLIAGAFVSWAGIWIGKAIVAESGAARPWAVTWSATGILLGLGLIASTVVSPLAGPALSVVLGSAVASGAPTEDGSAGIGVALAASIIGAILSLAVYAIAGSLVWWWMAHALRRAA
ncbi:hypothetical protein [Agreia bicolorata]|uniref:Uncharacterized protein n=1 Tax=Agreia bicolorata TaxID=110935 RepID=A0ABR5CEG8_9MICO|nr:hypothetical protein [Agreia bicolorata]KJC64016.1 hypothetical protein TZ00_10580 [Agreia bicolorata]